MRSPLSEYIADPSRKSALVEATGTSADYLWQIATSWRGKRASWELAMKIEVASGGVVRCEDLRPDVPWVRDPTGRPLIDAVALAQRRVA